MRKKIILSIVLLCIASFFQILSAQNSYTVNFSRNDYHAANQNWSLAVGSNQWLYAANNDGLLAYNGTSWRLHTLPQNATVRSVSVDKYNRIFVGSYEEFGYFETNELGKTRYVSLIDKLKNFSFHNEEIWKIVIVGENVYFQSFSTIFVFNGTTVEVLPTPGNIVFLLQARNRLFAQVIGRGLFELKGNQFLYITDSEQYLKSDVRVILPFAEKDFLIGTASDGMFVWNGSSFHPLQNTVNQSFKKYQVNCGVATANRIVIGTIVKGLFVLDKNGNVMEHLHTSNSLQNNTVLALHATQNGNLWVGLDKGIDFISFDLPLRIFRDHTLELGASYAAALYNNQLYLGTNQGVMNFTADSLGRFTCNGIVDNTQGQVWTLSVIDNTLFCGHNNGTFRFVNGNFERISPINGGFNLKKAIVDSNEYLLQSTYTNLVIYNKIDGKWQNARFLKDFVEPAPFLEPDFQQNIWVTHSFKGVYRIKMNSNFTEILHTDYLSKADGFASDYKLGVFKIQNRIIFTTGEKLYTWDDMNQRIVPYDIINNQLNGFENCRRIVALPNNLYWLIRKNDVALFRIKDNKAEQIYRMQPSHYNMFMVELFENIVPLNDSLNLLCLDNGFAILNVKQIEKKAQNTPPMTFTNIAAYNESGLSKSLKFNTKRTPHLPFKYNSISFSFTDFSFHTRQKQFWYRLKGLSDKWVEWRSSDSVIFSRLPAKKYTFEVKTTQTDGSFVPPLSYSFVIQQPYYFSIPAFIVYSLIIILLAVFIRFRFVYRFRKHSQKLKSEEAQKRLIEQQKAEREIISLRYDKLQAELSLKSVQLANSTMAILKKNELLTELKDVLEQQKQELGNRYPNKLYTQLKKLIDSNISTEDDWSMFQAHFDLAHEDFFKRLKTQYPDLTQSDLNLCALLRMNLSSKEIAQLLNITTRGVEIRRYRLRKRLNVASDVNLTEIMLRF